MNLLIYGFSALLQQMAATVQASATALINLTPGSVLRAILEAVASVLLWLQSLVLQVLALTRAATSSGADLDSWMADFGFTRLGAIPASGLVTFASFTSAQQRVVPIGGTVQSRDGLQNFVVTADGSNPAYSAALGGYVLAPGVASVSVPVQALAAGTGGNVIAGALSVITSAMPGIDTVTNSAAFINGIEAEKDPAFRARFILWISSLSKATDVAAAYAVASVRQGLSYTLTENRDYDGAVDFGFFYVVIDDGTGAPSDSLVAAVYAAIEAMRPLTVRFAVFKSNVVIAVPAMTLETAAGYVHDSVVAAVTAALQTAINGLRLGQPLNYTQLSTIAYSVPGVVNVTNVTLNGGINDLIASPKNLIRCGVPVVA